MPKGIKHGSNELAIAYVHGRIDAKIESTIDREIEIWSERFSIHPLELRQGVGTLSVTAPVDQLPAMRQASGVGSHGMAALEVVNATHAGGAQHHQHDNPQDAPHQVALPAPQEKKSRKGVTAWFNKDGSPMTPEQRKKESRRRMLKRKDPLAKAMLGAITSKEQLQTKKLEQKLAARRIADRDRHQRLREARKGQQPLIGRNGHPLISAEDRAAKQRIYQARHNARKAGVMLPSLPNETNQKSKVKTGLNGHRYPVQTPEEKRARHALHVARHEAKKKGLPLPPLPGETPAPEINVN